MEVMPTYIALLRGINVGGHRKVPMADLRSFLRDVGLRGARTYIQTGNIAFESDETDPGLLAGRILAVIGERFGFEPAVLVLRHAALADAAASNPFPAAEAEPNTLHLYFLAEAPAQPDLEGLHALRDNDEQFALRGTVFYLLAPAGIGRSRLAAQVEKLLGVPATARNWRTVSKVLQLAEKG
jgi:uncharacterized protein (DUF1697 family)